MPLKASSSPDASTFTALHGDLDVVESNIDKSSVLIVSRRLCSQNVSVVTADKTQRGAVVICYNNQISPNRQETQEVNTVLEREREGLWCALPKRITKG